MFQNLDTSKKPKNIIDIFKWKIQSQQPKWPSLIPLEATDIPPQKVDNDIRISYVGHVTFLIQTANLNILTDPVWSERVSPFSFAGPKRLIPPGIKFEDLPKIDIILISHNHYDHLDVATIKKLWHRDRPHIITPLMNNLVLEANIPGIEVTMLGWGEVTSIDKLIDINLEPAQHWSARGIFDRNKALWGTFIITIPSLGSICFIGDTGYSHEIFNNIGQKYDILVSLIPIGAFEPRWFMKDIHINPEEAVFIHQNLRSKYSIASHFDVFQLADEEFNQAPKELELAKKQYNIADDQFIVPKVSNCYWFNKESRYSEEPTK